MAGVYRSNSLDGMAYFRYDQNHLGDYEAIQWLNKNVPDNAVIVDVEATPARTYDEVAATKTMIDRTERCFALRPKRLTADTAYGTGKFLGWLVNDLLRHGFAHWGFPVLARTFGWHRIVRLDGTLSIARSYRPDEWLPILAEAGISDARVYRAFPFRLCVERLR